MKRILLPISLVALMLALATGSAAAQQTPAKKPTPAASSSTKTSTTTKSTGTTKPSTASKTSMTSLDKELRAFSNWVDEKLELPMANVRLDWGGIEAEYARMTKRLDGAADSLSAQSRREYLGQKARFKAWAAENGHPVVEEVLVGEARDSAVSEVQRRLLSSTAPINRAMASALPDLYARLVESTRVQHKRWTATNWAEANTVLDRLNARYDQVGSQLPLEDRARVRSLQAEFRTLEKVRDLKGILDGL
ncbi:hypothetical protein I2I05_07875 [Hymenobacter sp. BT683]|uniref:DUF349 domain-containing protein n=1 Tax=Hymenobacter jeongseonensis TaxID=2791027 RepID=A0ABS0IG26_9BACT|nr:hypothetical protein [Hymenobacter jeongseonensis]MBF9237313.1 hypothetical protein [Hymenobacter jeongseonensis]